MTVQPTDDTLPLTYNFTLYRGDTKRITVTIATNLGVALDLTGCVALATIKYSRGTVPVLVNMNATIDPDQITNPGKLVLEINSEDYILVPKITDKMELGVWDLEITWPGGDRITYLTGNVDLEGDVS